MLETCDDLLRKEKEVTEKLIVFSCCTRTSLKEILVRDEHGRLGKKNCNSEENTMVGC